MTEVALVIYGICIIYLILRKPNLRLVRIQGKKQQQIQAVEFKKIKKGRKSLTK